MTRFTDNRTTVFLTALLLAFIAAMVLLFFAPKTHAQPRLSVSRCPVALMLTDTCEAAVIDIVDGDTFKVRTQAIDSVQNLVVDSVTHTPRHVWIATYRDTVVSVRVVGIDSYETRRGDKLARQAAAAGISQSEAMRLGEMAKDHAKKLILRRTVTLCRDFTTPKLDIYCRPLYRVWFVKLGELVEYAEEFRNAGLADMNSKYTDKPKR
jgi:endonuclease YncB( thermonuclease family)